MCKFIYDQCVHMYTGKCEPKITEPVLHQCDYGKGYMCMNNNTYGGPGFNGYMARHPEYTTFIKCNTCKSKGVHGQFDGLITGDLILGHPGAVSERVITNMEEQMKRNA